MANTNSARKRIRTSERQYMRNKVWRSRLRTARKAFLTTVEGESDEASRKRFSAYCSVLDKAAKYGVIQKNRAIRSKRRAANRLS